jgi:hypothetical protein
MSPRILLILSLLAFTAYSYVYFANVSPRPVPLELE